MKIGTIYKVLLGFLAGFMISNIVHTKRNIESIQIINSSLMACTKEKQEIINKYSSIVKQIEVAVSGILPGVGEQ